MKKKRWILIVISFLGIISLIKSFHSLPTTHADQITLTVKQQALVSELFYAGIIQPGELYPITSPAEGTIASIHFSYGDAIQPKQLLFSIASEKFLEDYKATLKQYAKAKTAYSINLNQLKESEFLHQNKLIADDELKAKRVAFFNAKLETQEAESHLENSLKQLGNTSLSIDNISLENIDKMRDLQKTISDETLKIYAKHKGIIMMSPKSESLDELSELKHLKVGSHVKQGELIALLGNLNNLQVTISIDELHIQQVKKGMQVAIIGVTDQDLNLTGTITSLNRQAEANSNGTNIYQAQIMIKDIPSTLQSSILIGMAVKAVIHIDEGTKISVPLAAVETTEQGNFITVLDKNNHPKRKEVSIGHTIPQGVIIDQGLENGDRIVYPA